MLMLQREKLGVLGLLAIFAVWGQARPAVAGPEDLDSIFKSLPKTTLIAGGLTNFEQLKVDVEKLITVGDFDKGSSVVSMIRMYGHALFNPGYPFSKEGCAVVFLVPGDSKENPFHQGLLIGTDDPDKVLKKFKKSKDGIHSGNFQLGFFYHARGHLTAYGPKHLVYTKERASAAFIKKIPQGVTWKLRPEQTKLIEDATLFQHVDFKTILADEKVLNNLKEYRGSKGDIVPFPMGIKVDQLKDVDGVNISSRFQDVGFVLRMGGTARKGTGPAKLMAEYQPQGVPLFQGLPNEDCLALFGARNLGESLEKQAKKIDEKLGDLKLISKQSIAAAYKEFWRSVLKAVDLPYNSKVLSPGEQLAETLSPEVTRLAVMLTMLNEKKNGMLGITSIVGTKSSDKFLATLEKALTAKKPSGKPESVWDVLQFKRDAQTIDGAKVSTITFALDQLGANERDLASIKDKVGEDGLLLRIVAVDSKQVLVMLGGGKKRFQTVLASAKAGKSYIGHHPAILRANRCVPEKNIAEAYVFGEGLGERFLSPKPANFVPYNMTKTDCPNAFSFTIEDLTARMDILISAKFIRHLIDPPAGK